mgnify:FL=1
MMYTYDEMLRRMVYVVGVDDDLDIEEAVKVGEMFREMNETTREYVLGRLIMIKEELDNDDK